MCGIVAFVSSQEAARLLLEGLRQLEYPGYDSAGIATVNGEQQLSCLRAEGKLVNLTQRFEVSGSSGHCGIGPTRWATHGKPEERNAHPHLDGPGRVAVVQNGIIENYRTLREELQAVQAVLPRLHGAYALAVVWAKTPGALVVARKAALLTPLGIEQKSMSNRKRRRCGWRGICPRPRLDPLSESNIELRLTSDLLPPTSGQRAKGMPTVLRSGPYRFYFYSHEPNEPPHVHVDRDQYSCKFWLSPVAMSSNLGFSARELREIERLILLNGVTLLNAWLEFHG